MLQEEIKNKLIEPRDYMINLSKKKNIKEKNMKTPPMNKI